MTPSRFSCNNWRLYALFYCTTCCVRLCTFPLFYWLLYFISWIVTIRHWYFCYRLNSFYLKSFKNRYACLWCSIWQYRVPRCAGMHWSSSLWSALYWSQLWHPGTQQLVLHGRRIVFNVRFLHGIWFSSPSTETTGLWHCSLRWGAGCPAWWHCQSIEKVYHCCSLCDDLPHYYKTLNFICIDPPILYSFLSTMGKTIPQGYPGFCVKFPANFSKHSQLFNCVTLYPCFGSIPFKFAINWKQPVTSYPAH